jgi:transaldolase
MKFFIDTTTIHVLDAALMGADIATMPYKVMGQLINKPLTDVGLEKFLVDVKKRS